MLFQTNTTISLISFVLMFLTKNFLCSNAQVVNLQDNPVFKKPPLNSRKSRSLTAALKNWMLYENKVLEGKIKELEGKIKEKNEEYKKPKYPTETEKAYYEFEKLTGEIVLILRKDVLQLKKDFTKENYEEFLKHVDGLVENFEELQRSFSFVLTDEKKKRISEKIKELQAIPEKSEEIFTVGVVGSEEKDKIINIIKEVKKPRKNNNTVQNKESENATSIENKDQESITPIENNDSESNADENKESENATLVENKPTGNKSSLIKVFIWGGVILVVLLMVGLPIFIIKRRGD